MLRANVADDNFMIFFSENSIWQMPSKETVCIKCQIIFAGKKIRKIFQNVGYWNFTEHAKL